MRGLAAVSVVFAHFHDVWFERFQPLMARPAWGRLHALLTPLYAGHQAVMLFFVLSGFVLALPFEQGKPQPYLTFLARRVSRIYGPYLGALALAVAAASIWHGRLHIGPQFMTSWARTPSLRLIGHHAILIDTFNPYSLDPPVWSLVHEMRISLIFPVLWLITRRLGALGSILLALAFSITTILVTFGQRGASSVAFPATLHFAGFFVVGILLARYRRQLLTSSLAHSKLFLVASASLYFYGMLFSMLLQKLTHTSLDPNATVVLNEWVVLVGACGLILTALARPKALLHRVALFSGRISYSLYLTHVVVLFALCAAMPNLAAWTQLPLFLLLSLAVATLFCLCVEEPCTRWGRSLFRPAPGPWLPAALQHLKSDPLPLPSTQPLR